jgi:hypothetical protein
VYPEPGLVIDAEDRIPPDVMVPIPDALDEIPPSGFDTVINTVDNPV